MKPSFFVCGIVRNEPEKFRTNYDLLRKYFDDKGWDVYWYFYENDSTDNVVEVMQECADENPNFHFDSEVLGERKFGHVECPVRARHMCKCRNKYLERLASLDYAFDYMLLVDIDLDELSTEHIETAMSYNADMVGANGRMIYGNRHIYYDQWALYGCSWGEASLLGSQSEKVKVTSCFGGMGLYKCSSLRDCWYDPKVNHIRYADHGTLHEAMIEAGHSEMYICPPWITWS